MSLLKPMLAADAGDNLNYPLLASFKIDGIRATVQDGLFVSRSLKPLPNAHLQSIDKSTIDLFDGELTFGSPTSRDERGESDCYRKTSSAVMSKGGEPELTFYVFDHLGGLDDSYASRLRRLGAACLKQSADIRCVLLEQRLIHNEEQLNAYEQEALDLGYEGLIVRDAAAPYKQGRSTKKQGYLLKVKRFVDAEAEVIGLVELLINQNTAKKNELGQTQRSQAKAGLLPADTLGSFRVRDLVTGAEFNVGTGFTSAERKEIWRNQAQWVGKTIKYKHFPVGAKDLPRMPVYLGKRNPIDLS